MSTGNLQSLVPERDCSISGTGMVRYMNNFSAHADAKAQPEDL